ncbi:hypothetical protein BDL97_12G105600 [Sphagnum fallax]|nr:hypothetical protein BDL97_12G105600 [Sphagnum fallax]
MSRRKPFLSVVSFVGGFIALAVVELLLLLIYVFAKLLSFRAHKKQQNPASSSAARFHTCGQLVGGTPIPQGDWSKLKLQQASSKNKKKKKGAPTKDASSKREGLHDCLEIWPMRKHAILNNNINILSRELRMEQKK